MGASPQPRRWPGIGGVTLAEVERYGVERLLDELAAELNRVLREPGGLDTQARASGAMPALDSFGS